MEEVRLYLIGRDDLYTLYERFPEIQKFGRLIMEHMFIKKWLREASFLLDKHSNVMKTCWPMIQG